MDDILKIAIGVFIGALAAAFAWEGIQAIRLEIAADQVKQEIRRAQKKMRDEQQAREQAQFESDQRAADEQRQRDDQQRAAAQARLDAQRAKDAAWSRYYKPSPACVVDPSTAPCANEHLRARKLFEIQYDAGTLR